MAKLHILLRYILYVVLLCLFLFGILYEAWPDNALPIQVRNNTHPSTNTATVDKVIDGDSVRLANGEQVRYIGINAPELGEPFFEEAKMANRRLVLRKVIMMEICRPQPRDNYNRILAYVWVDSLNVNEELIRLGLVRTMIIPPCALQCSEQLRILEREAFCSGRGLWALQNPRKVPHDEAHRYIGHLMTVTGTVVNIHKGKKAIHLNFGQGYRTDFTAVIFLKILPSLLSKGLKPLEEFQGHEVAVTGHIKEYHGPEIIIDYADQIALVNP